MNAPLPNAISDGAAERGAVLAQIDGLRQTLARLELVVIGSASRPGEALFPRAWVDRVAELVAFEWGVDVLDLRGSRREARLTRPRFVWVWLVKQIGRYSYPQTALHCGYAEHTAVIHCCRRVDGWRDEQPGFRAVTDQLLAIGQMQRCNPGPDAALIEPEGETPAEEAQP